MFVDELSQPVARTRGRASTTSSRQIALTSRTSAFAVS